ncbi:MULTISPECIES: 6-hydroxymethylpterin diphosphokinase MptE-like protein [Nitrosopumilus]|uniref:6-hydroxymethyl-7,8-dihydropterin pyrophosphokinase n=1 Tax=Nitrosopumilus piranensis TaxID=1582439 RepID=A0A0C5BPR4_9ARCH|nr:MULTISPECIES: 6-hydroxymethylpterin diphosphokinase MptE-like protein [Nitrosopumilus]AJM91698.1 6-hydroxymethyl-7,8-dihydropterin pyrophosphokinase [Nitrosopumilus piranensis]KAF6245428.1 MAF flag10 domain containing protein [Nitrosopumilus sp. b2]
MMISGWKIKYSDILKEFNYNENKDKKSAILLNSILKKSSVDKKIHSLVHDKTVFVIGSGPSLSFAIPKIKKLKGIKIAADSSLKPLLENGIVPEIVVTDLDGDKDSFKKISKKAIFVVHAHGDNIEKLNMIKEFKNCIGTTQTKPFNKIQNFGGFTDGDRGVFLASHYGAKKIILFGMDFGNRIGKFSNTKKSERKIKLMKLKKGKSLLEWLATKTKSELFTTSMQIKGFKKIAYKDLDIIIT